MDPKDNDAPGNREDAVGEPAEEYITLPFAVAEETDEESGQTVYKNLPEHITFATILIDTEGERKRSSILSRGEERISAISKVYYPIALIPWMHERDLVMDPMGIWDHSFDYHRVVNTEIIMNELNAMKDIADMKNALRRCATAIKNISGVTKVEIPAMFYHEEFMKDLLAHMHLVQEAGERKGFLKPKLDRDSLERSVQKMHDLLERVEEDLGNLSRLNAFVHEKGILWNETLDAKIEATSEEYKQKIDELRPRVERKVKELEKKKNEESDALQKRIRDLETGLAGVTTKLERHEQNYMKFKGYQEKRVDAERERMMLNEAKREQRTIKSRIRDMEKKIRETEKQYKTLISREWDRLNRLSNERDDKLNVLKTEKEAVNDALANLLSLINGLIEDKQNDIEELESQGVLTPTFTKADYVYLPIYVSILEMKDKKRVLITPPMVAKKGKKMIEGIKSAFGGIVLPLEPKTKQFEKTFKAGLERGLTGDGIFAEALINAAKEVNILERDDIGSLVNYGLDTLLKESWIRAKHHTQIKERFEVLFGTKK